MSDTVEIGTDSTPNAPVHGHCAVTTTATPLTVSGLAPGRITRGILIRAPGAADLSGGNSAIVFVGGPAVTADNNVGTGGIPLPPGCAIELPCRDPSTVYVIVPAGSSSQDVAWLGA